MKRRIVLGALALAIAAFGADKPNFSGTWVLDKARSDFGQMTPPEKMERLIDHKDPVIKIKTTQSTPKGDRSADTEYTLDGKEQKQENPRGVVLYTPKWEGSVVVIDSKRNAMVAGQQVEITGFERWSLSADGKTMTVESKMALPNGEIKMTAVFARQ